MFKDVAESVVKEKNQEGNEWTACLVKDFPEKKENEPFIKKTRHVRGNKERRSSEHGPTGFSRIFLALGCAETEREK